MLNLVNSLMYDLLFAPILHVLYFSDIQVIENTLFFQNQMTFHSIFIPRMLYVVVVLFFIPGCCIENLTDQIWPLS